MFEFVFEFVFVKLIFYLYPFIVEYIFTKVTVMSLKAYSYKTITIAAKLCRLVKYECGINLVTGVLIILENRERVGKEDHYNDVNNSVCLFQNFKLTTTKSPSFRKNAPL